MSGFPGHANRPSGGASTGPNFRWWVPGTGINRTVITSEIQQYLGADALVRPGKGKEENQGRDGYWISAYRNLTSAMLEDLKQLSNRHEKQKEPVTSRFQEPHHDSRAALRPTPPLAHGASAYPPPTAPSPYGQEPGYPTPRNGQSASFGAPGYSAAPDPRDPYYNQTQQPPYPIHGHSGVSPNAPHHSHPHYVSGTPVSQPDNNYDYPSPPSQYAPHAQQPYGLAQGSTPRQQQYPPGYSGPPQPGYSYPTTLPPSSNAHPGYSQPYPQGSNHRY